MQISITQQEHVTLHWASVPSARVRDKFGKGGFDKTKIDPEKLKELKEKFGDKFGKGGFGKKKDDKEEE